MKIITQYYRKYTLHMYFDSKTLTFVIQYSKLKANLQAFSGAFHCISWPFSKNDYSNHVIQMQKVNHVLTKSWKA